MQEQQKEKRGDVPQTMATDELLARRRAIVTERRRMQVRHERELKRLSREHAVIMRELNWPLGCVTRPMGVA